MLNKKSKSSLSLAMHALKLAKVQDVTARKGPTNKLEAKNNSSLETGLTEQEVLTD